MLTLDMNKATAWPRWDFNKNVQLSAFVLISQNWNSRTRSISCQCPLLKPKADITSTVSVDQKMYVVYEQLAYSLLIIIGWYDLNHNYDS